MKYADNLNVYLIFELYANYIVNCYSLYTKA